jgi:hypothetical protein
MWLAFKMDWKGLMHMDNTLKGTNVEFNKNTKQKIIKINSGYFWVPRRIKQKAPGWCKQHVFIVVTKILPLLMYFCLHKSISKNLSW